MIERLQFLDQRWVSRSDLTPPPTVKGPKMSIDPPETRDVDSILGVLGRYGAEHPGARIEAYRYSPYSIRVRIIDPDFAGIDRGTRHHAIWDLFEELPEEIQSQISVVLLLTPEEAARSAGSFDFDHPIAPDDL